MTVVTSHSFITRPGQERLVTDELLHRFPGAKVATICPGFVESRGIFDPTGPLFFNRQILPAPEPISASSIREWVDRIFEYLKTRFEDKPPSWMLHVFSPETAGSGEMSSRAALIRSELLKRLKEKQRAYLRALNESPSPDMALVQVCLTTATTGVISLCPGEARTSLGALLSPFPCGYVPVPDDKAPPSRAFKKLREAIEVFGLGFQRGDQCVDLGASPGGWTHVLLEHDCSVIAIDRSPLSPPLMRNRRLEFITSNAFTWTPPKAVDWLVCDVITTPDRTSELLRRWVTEKLCRRFCVTVKFKGEPLLEPLFEISALLREKTRWFDGKQLTNNKNEVTVVGEVL